MSADNQVSQFQKRIKELESQNQILQEKVDYLTHKLFGRSSEQTSSLGIEGQMSIFEDNVRNCEKTSLVKRSYVPWPRRIVSVKAVTLL